MRHLEESTQNSDMEDANSGDFDEELLGNMDVGTDAMLAKLDLLPLASSNVDSGLGMEDLSFGQDSNECEFEPGTDRRSRRCALR